MRNRTSLPFPAYPADEALRVELSLLYRRLWLLDDLISALEGYAKDLSLEKSRRSRMAKPAARVITGSFASHPNAL